MTTQVSTTNSTQLPFSSLMSLAIDAIDAGTAYTTLTVWDYIAIDQIVAEHGRTRRGAAAVRNYLENRS